MRNGSSQNKLLIEAGKCNGNASCVEVCRIDGFCNTRSAVLYASRRVVHNK